MSRELKEFLVIDSKGKLKVIEMADDRRFSREKLERKRKLLAWSTFKVSSAEQRVNWRRWWQSSKGTWTWTDWRRWASSNLHTSFSPSLSLFFGLPLLCPSLSLSLHVLELPSWRRDSWDVLKGEKVVNQERGSGMCVFIQSLRITSFSLSFPSLNQKSNSLKTFFRFSFLLFLRSPSSLSPSLLLLYQNLFSLEWSLTFILVFPLINSIISVTFFPLSMSIFRFTFSFSSMFSPLFHTSF